VSRNYYSEINLHIVWHAKGSSPLLTPAVEPVAHRCLRKRIIDSPGAFVHDIGGTETHVHLAATVPPTLPISDWIGQLKGGSSHDVPTRRGRRADYRFAEKPRQRGSVCSDAHFDFSGVVTTMEARGYPIFRHYHQASRRHVVSIL